MLRQISTRPTRSIVVPISAFVVSHSASRGPTITGSTISMIFRGRVGRTELRALVRVEPAFEQRAENRRIDLRPVERGGL